MQEDNWQVNGVQTARLKCNSLAKGNSCPVNQYSLVASRGDLARNNCTARETPAPCIVDKRSKPTVNASTRAKHRDNLSLKGDIPCERLAKHAEGSTDFRKAQRPIRKSFSVPDYLREGKPILFSPPDLKMIDSFRSSFSFFNLFILSCLFSSSRTRFRKVSLTDLFFRIHSSLCHVTAIVSIFKTRDARSNIE